MTRRTATSSSSAPSLTVWRNPDALPQGARMSSSMTVPSVAAYISLAEQRNLVGTAVFVRRGVPAPAGAAGSLPTPDVRRLSPAAYRVGAGKPGWVVLPESADPWWRMRGRSAIALADGAAAIRAGPQAATAVYIGASRVLVGSSISGLSLMALLGGLGFDRRRRARRRPRHRRRPGAKAQHDRKAATLGMH